MGVVCFEFKFWYDVTKYFGLNYCRYKITSWAG
jgi:hypothetical protein